MSQTQQQAGQSQRWDCFCHHVTCVYFVGERRARFSIKSGVDGMTLQAVRVNQFNGKIVREKPFHMQPDSRIELFASPWPDLFYIVELDRYRQRWLCSCERELCEHIRAMRNISKQL